MKLWFDDNIVLKKLFKVPNFGTSSLDLAVLVTKIILRLDYFESLANPHDKTFLVDKVSNCCHKYVEIMLALWCTHSKTCWNISRPNISAKC